MKQTDTGNCLHKVVYRLSQNPNRVRITNADTPANSSLAMPHKILRFDNASTNRTDDRLRLLENATGTPIDTITCTGQPVTTWHYLIRCNFSFQRQPVSPENVMGCSGVDTGVSLATKNRSSNSRQNWSRFWVN